MIMSSITFKTVVSKEGEIGGITHISSLFMEQVVSDFVHLGIRKSSERIS